MKLRIAHLYPDLMNIYGDRGNVIAISRRCQWHGIDTEIVPVYLNQDFGPDEFDIMLIGGGQDKEQALVCNDLSKVKGRSLELAAEADAVILAICGGYQLLGKYFKIDAHTTLPGIGLLDVWTIATDQRMIGNVAIATNLSGTEQTLVGFENHSGKTYLGKGSKALGRVLSGAGNNGEDGFEGCIYRNVIGTYLHGALLPKNPWLTDLLINKALARKGIKWHPGALSDDVEDRAHQRVLQRLVKRQ